MNVQTAAPSLAPASGGRRKAIAALHLTLSQVITDHLPQLRAEKTLLVLDKFAAETSDAPPVSADQSPTVTPLG
jgi:hypothetical protein